MLGEGSGEEIQCNSASATLLAYSPWDSKDTHPGYGHLPKCYTKGQICYFTPENAIQAGCPVGVCFSSLKSFRKSNLRTHTPKCTHAWWRSTSGQVTWYFDSCIWGRVKASGELGKAAQVLSRSHLYHYSCFPSQDVILAFPTLGPRTPTPHQNMLSPHADSPDLQTNSPLPPQLFELPKAKTVPTTTEKLILFLQYNKARDQVSCCLHLHCSVLGWKVPALPCCCVVYASEVFWGSPSPPSAGWLPPAFRKQVS